MHKFILNGSIWINNNIEHKVSNKLVEFLNSTGIEFKNIMMPISSYTPQIAYQNFEEFNKLRRDSVLDGLPYICAVYIDSNLKNIQPEIILVLILNSELFNLTIIKNSYNWANCVTVYPSNNINNNKLYTNQVSLEHIFNICDKKDNSFILNLNKLGSQWYYILLTS
jgi:hypothetical protein